MQQSENRFEADATLWMKHWKEDKSPRHVAGTQRRLEANILPYFGLRRSRRSRLQMWSRWFDPRGARRARRSEASP